MAQTVLEGDWVKVTFDGDGTDSGEGNENLLVEALSQNTARVSTRSVTLNGDTDSGTHAECEISQNPKGPFIQFNEETISYAAGEKLAYVKGYSNVSKIYIDEIAGGGVSRNNIEEFVITPNNGEQYSGDFKPGMEYAEVGLNYEVTYEDDYGATEGYAFSLVIDISGWDRVSPIEITLNNSTAAGETYVEDYCEIVNDI